MMPNSSFAFYGTVSIVNDEYRFFDVDGREVSFTKPTAAEEWLLYIRALVYHGEEGRAELEADIQSYEADFPGEKTTRRG